MRRFFRTRPDRGTMVLLVTAAALLILSFLTPTDPVSRVHDNGRVVSEVMFGWQTILIATLRIACLLCLVFAALRHQGRIEDLAITDRR